VEIKDYLMVNQSRYLRIFCNQ